MQPKNGSLNVLSATQYDVWWLIGLSLASPAVLKKTSLFKARGKVSATA